jgi:O-antigen ligase
MPPSLALGLWFVLLLGLFIRDHTSEPRVSRAVWIPVVWIFIMGSRLPSVWLGGQIGQAEEALEEGNPLDRTIFLVLILLAIGVLFSRSLPWAKLLGRNRALMAFLAFALISVTWSDFPFVAFKRWFRDLGSYLMILVVLSDPQPFEATRALLRRLGYLLIPLSVVFIKYYPQLGRSYSQWTGQAYYCGVATDKNMLGVLCLLGGIFFFWDLTTRLSDRQERRKKWAVLVCILFIWMTLWILNLAQSATSSVCLAVGCLIVTTARLKWVKRHPAFLRVAIPASFFAYLILAFGFDMMGNMADAVGRDPTLTDRTIIWQTVLSLHTNPVIGTGYDSFWLGSRLPKIWEVVGRINEAHNGYLETYLNLGSIGVILLLGFLIASYRTLFRQMKLSYNSALLGLTIWAVILFYNMTEAAFKSGLLWVTLLLGVVTVPHAVKNYAVSAVATFFDRPNGEIIPVTDKHFFRL